MLLLSTKIVVVNSLIENYKETAHQSSYHYLKNFDPVSLLSTDSATCHIEPYRMSVSRTIKSTASSMCRVEQLGRVLYTFI